MKAQRKKDLESLAAQRRWPDGVYKLQDFKTAYRRVYETKNRRPTKSGWSLREPYQTRLNVDIFEQESDESVFRADTLNS
jgi:hypothetical protein